MSRIKLYGLLLLTVIAFPGLAWIIDWTGNSTFLADSIRTQLPILLQSLVGMIYGLIAGYIAVQIIKRPAMATTLTKYTNAFQLAELKKRDVIAIGIAAGIGEELLFRTVVQGYLGIWITAILFVAIHGYLNPKNKPLTVYGLSMVVLVAGIGWLKETLGLYSSITAHAMIDIVILFSLYQTGSKSKVTVNNI